MDCSGMAQPIHFSLVYASMLSFERTPSRRDEMSVSVGQPIWITKEVVNW